MTFLSNFKPQDKDQRATPIKNLVSQFTNIWFKKKYDVNAEIKFYTQSDTTVLAKLHYWTGSWITYIIQPVNFTFEGAPLQLILTKRLRELPLSTKPDKIMLLTYRSRMQTTAKVKYRLTVQQHFVKNTFLAPYKREWRSSFLYLSKTDKDFTFAPPGFLSYLTLTIYRRSLKFKQQKVMVHVSWQDGKLFSHQIELKQNTQNKIHIQIGNYHIIKFCSGIPCLEEKYSWNQAVNYCVSIEGNLPEILSRDVEEKIMNMLKNSHDLFLFRGIFLALKSDRFLPLLLLCYINLYCLRYMLILIQTLLLQMEQ